MSTNQITWRQDQLDALEATGDIVLTASAGTGKTTILVEKFCRKLVESIERTEDPQFVRHMVGITFTELAAAELNSRLRERIIREYAEAPDGSKKKSLLVQSLRSMDGAYIGTIHSFCRRLLQENFVEAGLSPGFSIIEDEDATELRIECAEATLNQSIRANGLILELSLQQGYNGLRDALISIASSLNADKSDYRDPARFVAQMREAMEEEVSAVIAAVERTLSDMNDWLIDFAADGSTASVDKALTNVQRLEEELADVFATPGLFLSANVPQSLQNKSDIPNLRNKGAEIFNDMREELFRLAGKEKGADRHLGLYAGAAAQFPYIEAFLALVGDYQDRYDAAKADRESLDFDDLLLKTLDLLSGNRGILQRYRSQFKYLYVDEFQDVNTVQRLIIDLLRGFGEEGDAERSLFIVGDGKQSIYRFRNADVTRFREFTGKIESSGGNVLKLKSNFRSTSILINSFNEVFRRLFGEDGAGRYQIEYSDIEPGKPDASGNGGSIELLRYPEKGHRNEAFAIARRIISMVDDPGNTGENRVKYGDFALLLRSRTILMEYEKELRRANLPYLVIDGRGFYQQREIWDLAAYLRLVWFPHDDYSLLTALRSPLCLLSDDTLVRLSRKRLLSTETLFEQATPDEFSHEEWPRFESFKRVYTRHSSLLDALTTADMIEELLNESGYDAAVLAEEAGDQQAANIRKLIEMAREFESRKLGGGLEFQRQLYDRLIADKNESQASLAAFTEDRVRIMTVHQSKGLQFRFVVIPHPHNKGSVDKGFLIYDRVTGLGVKSKDPKTGVYVPSATFRRVQQSIDEQDYAESLRLFYVAATRAKERVIIPCFDPAANKYKAPEKSWMGRLLGLGVFEEEAADTLGIAIVDAQAFDAVTRRTSDSIKESTRAAALDVETRAFIDSIFEPASPPRHFEYSVWGLINAMSAAPEEEIWAEENRIDDPDENAAIEDAEEDRQRRLDAGSAVHAVLEQIAPGATPSDETLHMMLKAASCEEDEARQAAKHLHRWLSSDAARRLAAHTCRHELPFLTLLELGDYSLKMRGVIDLLVEEDGGYSIYDYKYARRKDSQEYAMQLQLYALATQAATGKPVLNAGIIYLKEEPSIEPVDVGAGTLESLMSEVNGFLAMEVVL